MKRCWIHTALIAAAMCLSAPSARGQGAGGAEPEAGQVAAVLGSMRVERSTGAGELKIGDRLQIGDRLRTGAGDRAKILLSDNAVIDLGPDSELVIESRHTEAATGESESVLILLAGRMRAITPKTSGPAARFEVETPAAVAFRGRDFVMSYDPVAETSRVVAVDGDVSVAGKLGVVGGVVDVEPGFVTEVRKGRLPGAPQDVGPDEVADAIGATAMTGTGRQDGLDVLHPALRGRLLSSADVPAGRTKRLAQGLSLGAPGEFLAEQLSADVRTNTQPLLEYKQRDPGQPSVTGVEVEF